MLSKNQKNEEKTNEEVLMIIKCCFFKEKEDQPLITLNAVWIVVTHRLFLANYAVFYCFRLHDIACNPFAWNFDPKSTESIPIYLEKTIVLGLYLPRKVMSSNKLQG